MGAGGFYFFVFLSFVSKWIVKAIMKFDNYILQASISILSFYWCITIDKYLIDIGSGSLYCFYKLGLVKFIFEQYAILDMLKRKKGR